MCRPMPPSPPGRSRSINPWREGVWQPRLADGCSAASKRSSTPSGTDCWPLATTGGRGRVVRKHTRPRTRTEPSARGVASVTARPARAPRANGPARPKHVAAPADGRERRCASPEAQSAHRTPMSFPRSGTAPSRGANCRPNPPPLNRTACPVAAAVLGRRRARRSVSTAGRGNRPPRFHGRHYGGGGDRVSRLGPTPRAGPPHPGDDLPMPDRFVGQPVGQRILLRLEAADSTPFRDGSLVREPPQACRGERVNARLPLCRTEPSARGVAPATAPVARPAMGGRAAWPQDVARAADARPPPCESRGPQSVNRPPASISPSSTA